MKDLCYDVVDDCFIFVYSDKNAPDAEARALFAESKRKFPYVKKLLAFTDGGHPTASQRKDQQASFDLGGLRYAVVTESPVVRFVLVSASLILGNAMMGVSPREVAKAFAHLQLTPSQQDAICRWIKARAASSEFSHFKSLATASVHIAG